MKQVLFAFVLAMSTNALASGLADLNAKQVESLPLEKVEKLWMKAIGKSKGGDCIADPEAWNKATDPAKLTDAELCAVANYTDEAYSINAKLWTPKKPESKLTAQEAAFVRILDVALNKIPSESKRTVFSGTKKSHFPELKKGTKLTLDGYISTTEQQMTAEGFVDDLMLVVRARTGKNVKPYSAWEMEDELVLKRGVVLEVVKTEKKMMTLWREEGEVKREVEFVYLQELRK